MSNPQVISLVPGDDWLEALTVLQADGRPVDYSGWTIITANIAWPKGTIELSVDTAQAAIGVFGISAANAATGTLPYGPSSTMLIRGRSSVGKVETIYYAKVDGVHLKVTNSLTATRLGAQGPRGKSLEVVETPAELVDGFGYDGDTAIIRPTGAMWQKEAGVWSDTGNSFWGTLLQQGADQVQAARDAAEAAYRSENAAHDSEIAAGEDRRQTGEDRTATGQDRTTTGDDRRQTGEDRTATGQDKLATAADRVQTGLDRMATGGDVLSTAADVAVANAAKDLTIVQQILVAGLKAGVDTTYAAMIAALANVTNYENTLGQLTGAAKQIVAAADVVWASIYDTAKDTDCGIWRWRARGSWFYEPLNSATRGSRQFFPKRALIVARASSVTIYDLDDRACPMWMVFDMTAAGAGGGWFNSAAGAFGHDTYPVTGLAASNGKLFVTKWRSTGVDPQFTTGVFTVDFIADQATANTSNATYVFAGNLAARRSAAVPQWRQSSTVGIANANVNAVAATVLPGTPIDPVRRLPTPTVAVATAGGISVIHWDGRVANSGSPTARDKIWFAADGTLWFGLASGGDPLFSTPSEYAVTGFARHYYSPASTPPVPTSTMAGIISCGRNDIVRGGSFGLTRILHEQGSGLSVDAQNNRSSVLQITSTYNTGYQVGAIKMALAESTANVTSLVGAGASGYGAEIITDPTFSTATDWTFINGTEVSIAGGTMTVGAGGTDRATFKAGQQIFIPGKRYRVTFDITASSANFGFRFRYTPGSGSYGYSTIRQISGPAPLSGSYWTTVGSYSLIIEPLLPTAGYLYIDRASGHTGSVTLDNLSFQEVTLANDRSVAANHPVVVGTITRAAVAAGAELAAYSGWSTANYLETPYSSAFDFGTSDFAIPVWVKTTTSGQTILDRSAPGASGARILLDTTASAPRLYVSDGTNNTSVTSAATIIDGNWHLIVAVRRGLNIEIWVDGVLTGTATQAAARNVTNTSAVIRLGGRNDNTGPWNAGSIALARITATSPTPAQIRAMYAAEAPMFQAGAKCLLTGSDNVQAVAYDDATGLLYASNAVMGTDVFSGLVRVSSINIASENAVGSEIAVNGGFAADTNWAKGTGVTISGGALNFAAAPNSNGVTQTSATLLTAGKSYLVSYDVVSMSAGGVRVIIGSGSGVTRNAAGSYQEVVVAAATQSLIMVSSGVTTAVVDNFSVKEITTLRLSSDNHKGVSATNDNIAIFTDADCYMKTPSIGLREAMDTSIGRAPTPAPYNRNVIERPGCAVTSNATPTVIASFPMDKGEAGDWVVETVSREYGDPASQEFGLFRDHFYAYRPGEGNIALSGTSTQTIIRRVTATQAVTIQVNTTTQCIEVLATGVAAKNLEWGVKAVFFPVAQVA